MSGAGWVARSFNNVAMNNVAMAKLIAGVPVLDAMPEIHKKRVAAFYERYKPDYPLAMPRPSSFGGATTKLAKAGLELTAHVLGPGCSEAHVAVEFDGHLFVGDLVGSGEGISRFMTGSLDFGGTDAPLSEAQVAADTLRSTPASMATRHILVWSCPDANRLVLCPTCLLFWLK